MTMTKLTSNRGLRLLVSGIFLVVVVGAIAAPPTKITSEVASTTDLTAEVHSLLTTLEPMVASEEYFNQHRDQIRRQAIQIAILSQASADHDLEMSWKGAALELRNASLAVAKAKSQDEAAMAFSSAKLAFEGKLSTPAVGPSNWGNLASNGTLMSLMKERTELIRKGLRKSKNSETESRHAMVVALLVLAVHENSHAMKNPADKPAWQEFCQDVQVNMSRAAISIRDKDIGTAADHFRMGMEACDQCHQKFKP